VLLTQPFYRLLADYEQSGKRFDEFLPVILARLPRLSERAEMAHQSQKKRRPSRKCEKNFIFFL
jgi:hypothetical protein